MVAVLPPSVAQFSHVFCARCALASPTADTEVDGEEEKQREEGGRGQQAPPWPTAAEVGVVLADFCAQCGGRDALQYRWGFHLLLEDATGLLPCAVWGDEAALLLPGLSPCNLHLSRLTCRAVEQRLQRLLAHGAWLDCWLCSFPSPQLSSPPPPSHQRGLAAPAAASTVSGSWAFSPAFTATQEDSIGLFSEQEEDDSGDDAGGGRGGGGGLNAASHAQAVLSRQRHFRLILTVPNTTAA